MKNREQKTNALLETLAYRISSKKRKKDLNLMLNVKGSLIIGTLTSDYPYQNPHVKEASIDFSVIEVEYFLQTDTQTTPDQPHEYSKDLPDYFCQHILYLKDAYYVTNTSIKKAMQIRISDISSFSVIQKVHHASTQ